MLEQPDQNLNNADDYNRALPQLIDHDEDNPLKTTRTYSVVLDFFVNTMRVDMSFN